MRLNPRFRTQFSVSQLESKLVEIVYEMFFTQLNFFACGGCKGKKSLFEQSNPMSIVRT